MRSKRDNTVSKPGAGKEPQQKKNLHPRNRHNGRYDFEALSISCPELAPFVFKNAYETLSIDFANPDAVKVLNKALLIHFYKVAMWDIPPGYLCPPIPGRADYLHYMADLLGEGNEGVVPRGKHIHIMDIGVGANCIYPLIGHSEYGWRFTGTDIDPIALTCAKRIVKANTQLKGTIDLRLQTSPTAIFKGLLQAGEHFDITICNPPFHASYEEAYEGSRRKWKNLGKEQAVISADETSPVLNFGGQATELWCTGGEKGFIRALIEESAQIPTRCFWFSALVSKEDSLPLIYKALQKVEAVAIRTLEMTQGQKKSRIVAWTFLTPAQQTAWRAKRWIEG